MGSIFSCCVILFEWEKSGSQKSCALSQFRHQQAQAGLRLVTPGSFSDPSKHLFGASVCLALVYTLGAYSKQDPEGPGLRGPVSPVEGND